jgi:hypothetical protein
LLPLISKLRNNWRSEESKLVLDYSYVHREYFCYLVWRMEMRELTLDEIEQVSGGSGIGEYAADGGGLGSLVGTLSSGTLYGAARGGMVGGLLGASFGAGHMAGSALYDWLS